MNDGPPYHIWSFYKIFYRKITGFTEFLELSCKKIPYHDSIRWEREEAGGLMNRRGVSTWYTGGTSAFY